MAETSNTDGPTSLPYKYDKCNYDLEREKRINKLLLRQIDLLTDTHNLKYTATIGTTPSSTFDSGKPNYKVLSINYNCSDGRGDFIKVILEKVNSIYSIDISTQEAVQLGFINPYGLDKYFKQI